MHCQFFLILGAGKWWFKFSYLFSSVYGDVSHYLLLCRNVKKYVMQFCSQWWTCIPSVPLPFMNNVQSTYQRLWGLHRVSLNAHLPLGVNFHQRFPINLSIAPWTVYFPYCLKIIATCTSGLNRCLWTFSYITNTPLNVLFIFYCCIGISIH
jgi:hypothetical protein